MYYQVLLIIGVCAKIASASNCTRQTNLELDTIGCCPEAWKEINEVIVSDPCFQIKEGDIIEEMCMVDCFYKRHNISVNGDIVLENGIRFLRSFGTKEFQDVFVRAFEECFKFDWSELTSKFGHQIHNPNGKCPPKTLIFDSCIAVSVIWICPKHMWKESDYCSSEKSFLDKCIFNK